MAVTIKLQYIRHSAKKLRPLARAIQGKSLTVALNTTAVMPQDSARFLHKALLMAQASASAKEFDPTTMVVSGAMATEGPKIKRIRANARGRANGYQKHLAHLTVSLDQAKETKKTPRHLKKAAKETK